MCGFTVFNAKVKLLLFAFIFISNINDYCLLAHNDPEGRIGTTSTHTNTHNNNNLNKVNVQENIERIYDGHANNVNGNNVFPILDVYGNVFDSHENVGATTNSTGSTKRWHWENAKMDSDQRWAKSQNLTLRLGYANDPFGVSPPEGALLPLQLRPEEKREKQEDKYVGKIAHESADGTKSKTNQNRTRTNVLVTVGHKQSTTTTTTARIHKTQRNKSRMKRGVVQLYNMVRCATGCDPLIYKGYGCYCGFLGSGYPVDGIDKCCKMHDICYDVANCPMYLEYVVPYYWKCYRGKSLCAVDHLDLGGSGSCAQRLCECDRLLSECLSRFPCPRRRAKCVSSPWRLLQNTLMFF